MKAAPKEEFPKGDDNQVPQDALNVHPDSSIDATRLMTSAVQDTSYWLADVTGDDDDILDAEGDASEHHHTSHDVDDDSQEGFSLQHIQDVLDNASNVVEDLEDVEAAPEEEFSKGDDDQIPQNALNVHSDSSIDVTYTSRPKRVLAPSQKILLNEKWSDIKMWAQRAIVHIKCNAILQSKRMYYRLVIVDHENSQHYNFESKFDLANAVQKIAKMRRNQDIDDVDDYEPLTYKEAMIGFYIKQWSETINKQMQFFAIMNIWRLIKRSKNALVLSDKWVYKIKKRLDETILYKARWVVRGFEKIYDINYDQTFVFVVKSMSFKVLFFIMIYYDLDCEQMNVITVFLNALLKKRIYVKQLKKYKNDKYDIICLLLRALYSLKQFSREWYAILRDFLISKDFKHIESNHSLFVNEETRLIVSVYVNDIQIYDPRRSKHISNLKKELSKRFAIIDLDLCSYYLSIEIQRNRAKRSVRITQSTYLKKVLARFNMTNSAPVLTLIIVDTQLKEKLVNQAISNVVREYQLMMKSMIYVIM